MKKGEDEFRENNFNNTDEPNNSNNAKANLNNDSKNDSIPDGKAPSNLQDDITPSQDNSGDIGPSGSDLSSSPSNVDGASGLSQVGSVLGGAASAKDTIQNGNDQLKTLSDNAGDIYADQVDGFTETVEDMKQVATGGVKAAVDAGVAVAKGAAGDVPGAVKSGIDAVKNVGKIVPALLRLIIPLIIISVMIMIFFLRSPAMIWDNLSQKYEDWAYSKAISAIDDGIDDAAFNVVDDVRDGIETFFDEDDFKTKCNQYYENYVGNGYTKNYADGTALSIELRPSEDGQHEDAYITYTRKNGEIDTVVFKGADVSYNELDTDVSYTQIINAFNMYRENKAKNSKSYQVYNNFTDDVKEQISKLREEYYSNNSTLDEFKNNSEKILEDNNGDTQPLKETMSENQDDEEDTWGLADTSALYYYMTHDENLAKSLYDYTITNTQGETITDLKSEKDKTSVNSNSYQIVIDVTTFDANDAQTEDGTYYSSAVMKGFGITSKEDIEKAVTNAIASDILLDAATSTVQDASNEFVSFISWSQPKILFEKIVGGPSIIEKMIDAGLYGDWDEEKVRNLMAMNASGWVNATQSVSTGDETFFFRTNDEFVNAFKGTSKGWEYDPSTGSYKSNPKTFDALDAKKYLNEDGMFMTFLFSQSLNAGMLKDDEGNSLKPRTYIFPQVYTSNDSKKNVDQLFSSQDYYYYFQNYGLNGSDTKDPSGDTAWYQLSKYIKGVDADAWDMAFDNTRIETTTHHKSCIEKGDLIFLTYFAASVIDVDTLKDLNESNFNWFYGNKGYQVGIVTDVDYSAKTITFVVYNYDDDPIKQNILDATYDTTFQRYLGKSQIKVSKITVTYDGNGEGSISPEWNDSIMNKLNKLNSTLGIIGKESWTPNPLTFISGYAKPDYGAYVDEINRRLEIYREEMAKSLAEAALDLGGGTLGYPLDEDHRKISQDYSSGGHAGIDYGVAEGTPVYASADGVVLDSKAITEGGSPGRGSPARAPNGKLYRSYGEYIKIQHSDSGLTTYYGHLSKRIVNKGDTVKRGQLIGYSGNTGNSSGPHLHFEVRQGGNVVNPHNFLSNSVTKKVGKYSYKLNEYITTSPVNNGKINVTFYCPGSCCNGPNAGTTAMGFSIRNTHKYYDSDQAYVACNWLPLGSKIRIDFGNDSSMGWFRNENLVYTVADTGSADRLKTSTIDVMVPNDHAKTYIGHGGGQNYVKIKILSLGTRGVNV